MKITIQIALSIIIHFIGLALQAQKFEININAGANLTFVPDFTNIIAITNGGLVIPDIVNPQNSVLPTIVGKAQSESKVKIGLLTELELGIRTNEKTKFSLLLGLNQMKFQYDTYVNFDNTTSGNLSALNKDYGKTNLLYFEIKPINLSLAIYKKLITLQFGSSFDFLIKSQQNNIIIHYTTYLRQDGNTYDIMDKIYFDSTGELSKVLYGFYMRTGITIFKQLDLTISGQYYFNSIYKNSESYNSFISDSKPVQLQFGLNYSFWNFGTRN